MTTRHRKPGPIRKAAETLLGGAAGIGAVTAVATVMHTGGTPAAAGTTQTAPASAGAAAGAGPAVVVTGDTPVSDVADPASPDATGSVTPTDVATNPRIQYQPTHAAPTRGFEPVSTPLPTQGSTTPPPVLRSRPTDPPTSGLPSGAPTGAPTSVPTSTPTTPVSTPTSPAPPTTTPSQPGEGGGGGSGGSGGGDGGLGGLLSGVLGTLGTVTGTVLGLGRH
ncbi:hypothetical protein KGQ20_41485 [Catenulispora sp. NF23]|uniref:Uncharacterized protein n=1 Tax=Catenulispora pinistramenti TaxID=2705254 RepID=A0ABS5KHZ3_9ACTN|nr:hypothetical protein [Catenulispora pinistramenti]MBS2539239.1 hypothetical protein [Catenulispora pinistramenti]MBS2545662.1 hypothetical protein [Catenulispora pinistramenti]